MKNVKVKMGMIGGGRDGFIGSVHRKAAALDGLIELKCGAFSSDPGRSREMGEELSLPDDRVYGSYQEMLKQESALPPGEKIDFVAIVTPNYLHFEQSMLALEKGFHVLCEKPVTFSLQEAHQLQEMVRKTDLLFGVTHNYTGYPMVKEARNIVQSGRLGKIRKVIAEYPQGWLSTNIEKEGQKQAAWRMDPSKAGISCCIADIGTHAENLSEYITGLKITELSADITTFVEGRQLEDDANILLRFENGAKGVLIASQIAAGDENELRIRVYGEKGSIEWLQTSPQQLQLKFNDAPLQILKAGASNNYLSIQALAHCRIPGGHPEGYIESLANVYRNFGYAIQARSGSAQKEPSVFDFPNIDDGTRGMRFIEAAITSGKNNAAWVKI